MINCDIQLELQIIASKGNGLACIQPRRMIREYDVDCVVTSCVIECWEYLDICPLLASLLDVVQREIANPSQPLHEYILHV
jgi:hypothetical protein